MRSTYTFRILNDKTETVRSRAVFSVRGRVRFLCSANDSEKEEKYGRYEGLIIIRIIMRVCCTGVVYTRHEVAQRRVAAPGARRCNRPNLD